MIVKDWRGAVVGTCRGFPHIGHWPLPNGDHYCVMIDDGPDVPSGEMHAVSLRRDQDPAVLPSFSAP